VVAESWISHGAFKKLFIFQVVNVFFVALVAGSVFGSINEISSLSSAINLLGSAIPRTGTFFTTYVMIQSE
jgi:calcium permeable stress-gated cation channel